MRHISTVLGIIVLVFVGMPASASPEGSFVRGRCVLKGKSLELHHAYLVQGPDRWDPKKQIRYVVLSREDVSEAIGKCSDLKCAAWDVVREGMILEPEKDGSFWLRIVHPELPGERQVSYRGFEASTDEPKRLAGKLAYGLEKDIVLEIEFDALLIKDFSTASGATKPR